MLTIYDVIYIPEYYEGLAEFFLILLTVKY